MAAVGPLLGGWLTTYLTWRWAFFINIPVAVIAIIGHAPLHRRVARTSTPRRASTPSGSCSSRFGPRRVRLRPDRGPHLRLVGADASRSRCSAGPGRSRHISIIPFALGVRPRRRWSCSSSWSAGGRGPASSSCSTSTLWRYPAFRYGNLAGTIVSLGEFGLLFALPLFLQARRRLLGVRDRPRVPVAGGGRVLRRARWPPVARTAGARGGPSRWAWRSRRSASSPRRCSSPRRHRPPARDPAVRVRHRRRASRRPS